MTAPPDGGLTAALLQISQHAERIAGLDEREARNVRHLETTLAAMSTAIAGLKATVDGQAKVLESLDGLGESVALLAAQVASLLPPEPEGGGYQPAPAVHWWAIKDQERQKAVAHLRAWVEQVYRPHYGHLAAKLSPCWEEHPLALVQLDWLSELHSVLYFQPRRTAGLLMSQAEFGIRIVPTFADQLGRETSSCRHRRPVTNGSSTWAGAR
jgi:hypothetical protein